MNREKLLEMLMQAGFEYTSDLVSKIDKFEKLLEIEHERLKWDGLHSCHSECNRPACVHTRKAVEAEREACLDLCYTIGNEFKEEWAEHNEDKYWERCLGAGECADAIRARGQE